MAFLHNLILFFLVLWTKLGGHRPRLKKWIALETYKDKILKAVENRQAEFPRLLLAYLSTAFGVSYKLFDHADWMMLVKAFYTVSIKSPKIDLPMATPSNDKQDDAPWDYPDRTWSLYSHMLAKTYGWTLEYISQLQVGEALAKIQEILVDEQLEREFYYSLSENAFEYDKHTQKSKFVPLPRPTWMRPKVEPEKIKKFPIPASMLPFGVVNPDALPEELLPKEYEKPEETHSR